MDKSHYICTGECEGVSNTPGVCRATDCNRFEQKLVECNCVDGDHRVVRSVFELEDSTEE
jgi:hypothetical protein